MKTDKLKIDHAHTIECLNRLPVPECYVNMSRQDYQSGCDQMVKDLMQLAHEDGCIAAAWALAVIDEAGRLED